MSYLIRPMEVGDRPLVTRWAQQEGFCPGIGDLGIFYDTDNSGVWVGEWEGKPVGCIAGIRYDENYGFIGLFLVQPEYRGRGFGVALWQTAIAHLENVSCVGLEAALARVEDYQKWGFRPAYYTRRYRLPPADRRSCVRPSFAPDLPPGYQLMAGDELTEAKVQAYDARHEATPRPLFLHEWLGRPEGKVMVILDNQGDCCGYGRIRPCLLPDDEDGFPQGWRLGPLMADSTALAGALLDMLLGDRQGPVFIDVPEINQDAIYLLEERGFELTLLNLRMYKGNPPQLPLEDIYGLACLELG
ncbi:GNAT family N-acetyltransferase [Synechocystis salina LEGE 06099]|uniref:GNAT family N-acetyltransferase n=1 Tax=Synechocystis salina TaxID=945780 RepID=UPI001881CE66|nr:GNAT family N-acetyltransferase [Synechocystis salina]MBE9204483.1 GNAT family N-acetyltransferase [Synechocystis salina LEGE 06099]